MEKKNLLSEVKNNKDILIQLDKQLEIRKTEIKRILESYKYSIAPSGSLICF